MRKKYIYMGVRERDGKLVQVFKQGKTTASWTRLKYLWIGDLYESTDEDRMPIRPDSLGRAPMVSDEDVAKWELEDQAARQVAARVRATKKVQKFSSLEDRTLRQLKVAFQKLNWHDKHAFVERISWYLFSRD